MAKMPSGLSENPGEVYALADRFHCKKCICTPTMTSAKFDNDSGVVSASFSCHGEKTSWQGTREDLRKHNIGVFEADPT